MTKSFSLIAVLAVLLMTVSLRGIARSPASGGLLLVANKGESTMGIVDVDAGTQLAAVPENGVTGHEVIASPDGRTGYVPIYGDSGVGKPGSDGQKVVAIDLATRAITATLDFGHGVRPHCPMFGPKDGLLYVTTELEQAITLVDPKTMKVVGTVPTGQAESHMLAISKDGTRGYTANVGPGTVSVLDLEARKTLKIVPIATHTQRISLSVDDKWAFTSDTDQPRIAAINTATSTVDHWIALASPGYGTAATIDGKYLLVAMPKANAVAVVDLSTFTVTKTIDVPPTPQEMLVRPDGKMAYVSCDMSGKIVEIRTSDWGIEKTITAGKVADGLAWAPR